MGVAQKKVLIVDDEEILTWIMSKTLSRDRKRYDVLIANDGHKALEILKKESIDLVISDIRMPGLSGMELLDEIRKNYPQTKVIIMTAYGNPDVQKECNERGCLHYLEKPFKIEELRAVILNAIKETKKGFVGKVMDLQLTDIIQLNCLGRMTTAISVVKEDQEGILYFRNGEIVHAEVGDKTGEEALFTILGWEGGDFTTLTGAEPMEETISKGWQELLIEGMRRKDEGLTSTQASATQPETGKGDLAEVEEEGEEEKEGDSFDSPGFDFATGRPVADRKETSSERKEPLSQIPYRIPKEDVSPAAKRVPLPAKSGKDRKTLLKQILVEWGTNSEEIEGAAIVTLDGRPLTYHFSKPMEVDAVRFGAIAAAFYNTSKKVASETKKGFVKELDVIGSSGSLHVYLVARRVLLVAIGKGEANIGMLQIEAAEVGKRMESILRLE